MPDFRYWPKGQVVSDNQGIDIYPFETWLWRDIPHYPDYALCPEGRVLDKQIYLKAKRCLDRDLSILWPALPGVRLGDISNPRFQSLFQTHFGLPFTDPTKAILPTKNPRGTDLTVRLHGVPMSVSWLLIQYFIGPCPPGYMLQVEHYWYNDPDVKWLRWVPTRETLKAALAPGKPAKIKPGDIFTHAQLTGRATVTREQRAEMRRRSTMRK